MRVWVKLACLLLAAALLGGCQAVGAAAPQSTGGASTGQLPGQPGAVHAQSGQSPGAPATESSGAEAPLLQCMFYERELFLAGAAAPRPYTGNGRLVAGIVPHHLLAADMLSGFFALAAQTGYDTVFVLSPAHYPRQCRANVVTAAQGWSTPLGRVEVDAALAGRLLADGELAAAQDGPALEQDHGGAGLVPYVAHYLPGAEVVVCLATPDTTARQVQRLTEQVLAYGEERRVLFLATADFSHYQQPDAAARYDDITRQCVEAFDYAAIARFGDEHVDSPQALAAFLQAVQASGAPLSLLDHSSSQQKLAAGLSSPVYEEGVTTYFVWAAFV